MEQILSWNSDKVDCYFTRRLNWEVRYLYHPELIVTTMLEF